MRTCLGRMNTLRGAIIARYLYGHRVHYAIVVYIYIAAFSCGVFVGGRNGTAEVLCNSMPLLLLRTLLPVVAIILGGLFFVGQLLAVWGECYCAYCIGRLIASAFGVSFFSGSAYLLFVGIPVGLIYFVCVCFAGVNALECNLSRLRIRAKGLKRRMTHEEIRIYIAKSMISIGVCLICNALEHLVFAKAYVNLIL